VNYNNHTLMKRTSGGQSLKTLLSSNIKLFRIHSGLSQAQLAEKAGISVPFLGAVERGDKWPSAGTIAEIAGALSIQPYDLLKPENTSSRNVRQVVAKLAVDISTLMNETVKTLNNIAKEES